MKIQQNLQFYRHLPGRVTNGVQTLRTQDTSDPRNFRPRTLRHVRSVPTLGTNTSASVPMFQKTLRHHTCGVG